MLSGQKDWGGFSCGERKSCKGIIRKWQLAKWGAVQFSEKICTVRVKGLRLKEDKWGAVKGYEVKGG